MEELLRRQAALPYDFPPGTEAVQLSAFQARRAEVEALSREVSPLVSPHLCQLLRSWLQAKRMLGSQSQQWGGFEDIGTCKQGSPLLLQDYLSYDEMQISALISVAVPTLFINNGGRDSLCKPGDQGTYEDTGVLVACVGARMVLPGRMEAEHMVVTGETKTPGPITEAWEEFYGLRFGTLSDAQADKEERRFHRIGADCSWCKRRSQEAWTERTGWRKRTYCRTCMESYYGGAVSKPADMPKYLDKEIYQLRIRQTVRPFLLYASERGLRHRARAEGHPLGAHARVKGLGLGAWWIDPIQEPLMYRVYERILREEPLEGIDVLDFSFFPSAVPDSVVSAGAAHGIQVIATQSGFAEPVHGRLLVAMYAWDGNAHPGNEWWAESGGRNYLGMTDDSAAASCSLITSLQHPEINRERLCFAAASLY